MSYPLDRNRERYQNDVAFKHVVDALQVAIMECHLSPSEVRAAAMLACMMVEERYPKPFVIPVHALTDADAFSRMTFQDVIKPLRALHSKHQTPVADCIFCNGDVT